MRIRKSPSANAQAMIRVGSPARRSSTVRGGRWRRAVDVNGGDLRQLAGAAVDADRAAALLHDLGLGRVDAHELLGLRLRGLGGRHEVLGVVLHLRLEGLIGPPVLHPVAAAARAGPPGSARSGARARAGSPRRSPSRRRAAGAERLVARGRTGRAGALPSVCVLVRPLTGLADGLAPERAALRSRDSPQRVGPPLPGPSGELSG